MSFLKKITVIFILFLALFIATTVLISNKHWIFAKWVFQAARCIGKPLKAQIYTDGILNNEVNLFHVDKYWHNEKADYYIIIFPQDSIKMYRNIYFLDRMHSFAGVASSTNIEDYDQLFGYLFQSEVGAQYTPFTDDTKGFAFDPKLSFKDNTIKFNLPQNTDAYKCDSVRIELL